MNESDTMRLFNEKDEKLIKLGLLKNLLAEMVGEATLELERIEDGAKRPGSSLLSSGHAQILENRCRR